MITNLVLNINKSIYNKLKQQLTFNDLAVLKAITLREDYPDTLHLYDPESNWEYSHISNEQLLEDLPYLGLKKAVSFKHIIKRLETNGLLLRYKNNTTERKQFLGITQLGINLLK